jgi:transcriptional regulator of acetoin/glycerol metabolism
MSHQRKLLLYHPNGKHKTLNELKKEIIMSTEIHFKYNMSEVSRALGVGRSTLYKQLQRKSK